MTSAASATDAASQENIYGTGVTTLIISNNEMEDFMKIVKSPVESGLLSEVASETIKNKTKQQKSRCYWDVIRYISC